uniref:Uncharacterized protein n=1 Tax=Peronospora matthiolae TaxID=2874970 RepID=A0AAV1TE80_9STRA
MDADVDAIDIDDGDDEDAGIFSIVDKCHSEDDDALTGKDNVLSALRTKITSHNKDKPAD